jgi:NAD(P)-dependent dehydrogenase (short-subunit alcohol dehydrogenase family)
MDLVTEYEMSTDSKISNMADPLVARIERRGNFSWFHKDAYCVSKAFVVALTKALAAGNPQHLIIWYAHLANGQIATC